MAYTQVERTYGDRMRAIYRMVVDLCVASGALWLDKQQPHTSGRRWERIMLRYLPVFDIADGSICVIGSLLRGEFLNGVMEAAGITNPEGAPDDQVSAQFITYLESQGITDGGRGMGFNLPTESEWPALDGASDYVSSGQGWTLLTEAWMRESYQRLTPDDVHTALREQEEAVARLEEYLARTKAAVAEAIPEPTSVTEARERLRRAVAAVEAAEDRLERAQEEETAADSALEDAREEQSAAEEAKDEAEQELGDQRYARQEALEKARRGAQEQLGRARMQLRMVREASEKQAVYDAMLPFEDLMTAVRGRSPGSPSVANPLQLTTQDRYGDDV